MLSPRLTYMDYFALGVMMKQIGDMLLLLFAYYVRSAIQTFE